EDVAGRPECFGDLALEVEEHREREPHAPPFVGDGRAAKRAAHLARRHAPGSSELAGIEAEMLDPANHSEIVLEENRGPLHGGAVQCLAGAAVADLGIHRIGADLIADRAAMAACAVARDERLVVDRGVVGTEIAHRRLDSFDGGRHDDHQENGFMPEITLDVYKAMVGQEVGVSRSLEVPQERIDAFADVAEDHQFIHVDPERATATPFGGTVAHGFLTMSLLAPMAFDAQPTLAGTVTVVNYGFDRLRLIAPVRAGSRIRGRFVLKEVVDRGPKEIMTKTEVAVEIEGGDKPALVADLLGLTRFAWSLSVMLGANGLRASSK